MPDPHVLSALEGKAHDLRSAIVAYEKHLERALQELAAVTSTVAIMGRDGHLLSPAIGPAHFRNLFKRGEVLALCKTALAGSPDGLTTRESAVACSAARGYASDPVLAMVGCWRIR